MKLRTGLASSVALIATAVGLSTAVGVSPASAAGATQDFASGRRGINHWQTYTLEYRCPDSFPYARSWYNTSSSNVTAIEDHRGPWSIAVTFTNWNLTGDQDTGIVMRCGTTVS